MSEIAKTHTHKVMFAALVVAMAVALAFAIAPAFVTSASARISYQNPGGNESQGQCEGRALERVYPAGHAPPGQQ
jgi:hypothetical protein